MQYGAQRMSKRKQKLRDSQQILLDRKGQKVSHFGGTQDHTLRLICPCVFFSSKCVQFSYRIFSIHSIEPVSDSMPMDPIMPMDGSRCYIIESLIIPSTIQIVSIKMSTIFACYA